MALSDEEVLKLAQESNEESQRGVQFVGGVIIIAIAIIAAVIYHIYA